MRIAYARLRFVGSETRFESDGSDPITFRGLDVAVSLMRTVYYESASRTRTAARIDLVNAQMIFGISTPKTDEWKPFLVIPLNTLSTMSVRAVYEQVDRARRRRKDRQ